MNPTLSKSILFAVITPALGFFNHGTITLCKISGPLQLDAHRTYHARDHNSIVTGKRSILSPCCGSASDARDGLASTTTKRMQDIVGDPILRKVAVPLAISSALLGPNLDNYHSAFGVLSYTNPIKIMAGGVTLLTTDWWVPPLFAVAGVGIGLLYVGLDEFLNTPPSDRSPVWGSVLVAISSFSFQYYLSGLLTSVGCPSWLLWGCLLGISGLVYSNFDNTRVGLMVSLITAVLGPLIEVFLVNVLHLYRYNGADMMGVDSWIPYIVHFPTYENGVHNELIFPILNTVVYFCGGPAVGGLARALCSQIGRWEKEEEEEME